LSKLPASLLNILVSCSDFSGILVLAVQAQLLKRAPSASLAVAAWPALLSIAAATAALRSIAASSSAGRSSRGVIRRSRT
jgi:hypothetical protein